MRSTRLWLFALACAACGGVEPRVIQGGGISDGPIDGTLYVHVISDDDVPVAATVRVGDVDKTTNADGLATFEDVSGPQTIAVLAEGFRSAVWVGANGANVTIMLEPRGSVVPESATLSGSIEGWSTIQVGTNHIAAALVFYSQTDDLGDEANELRTPNNGNICGVNAATCDWTLLSRTGPLTIVAAIVDRDTKGTIAEGDDTTTIIGWATRTATVEPNVGQTGLVLTRVEAGNLENVTVDLGSPPAALTQTAALVGVEVGEDEVVQLPMFLSTDRTTLLAPKRTVFGADATYRLTAIAQTTSGGLGAQSILLRRGQTETALAAGDWLVPPTGVSVTRTSATFQSVANAKIHTVAWSDTGGALLEIAIFDGTTSVDVPSLVALPASGLLTARVGGLGANIDVTDFSLEEDDDFLWGIAAEPVAVP